MSDPFTESPSSELLQERRGDVLWLTINRESRSNSISPAVLAGIGEGLNHAAADPTLRAVVLTGAGTRAFCAGGDLQTGRTFKYDYAEPRMALGNVLRLARRATVPLIARVNGACMAGGMGLLGMCDLAVASESAVFGLPEVKVGVFPFQVISVMGRHVPRRVLNEMALTGEPLNAQQALTYGLVNHVAPDAELDARLDGLLSRILDKSPPAIRRGLYAMKAIETMGFEESVSFSESQIALLALTEDSAEGQLAFREKRKPRWSGR